MAYRKKQVPDLENLLTEILKRDRYNDPARVDPYQETEWQRNRRMRNYLESGATPLCGQCENMLLLCNCTDLEYGDKIIFGWPESYTKKEKRSNLLRWVSSFQNEIPKTKINVSMFNLPLFARDFLKKNIINVLSKRKKDLEAIMCNHIRLNNNDPTVENYGNDAVMFLTDLNLSCACQVHWIIMNNAFQSSDPNKYRINDPELKLIFSFLSVLIDFHDSVKKLNNSINQKTCSNCSKPVCALKRIMRCSRCKKVYYCNADCQRSDWKKHKAKCCMNEDIRTNRIVNSISSKTNKLRMKFLKRCAYGKCNVTKTETKLYKCKGVNFQKDIGCLTFYCSKYCQKRDWIKNHRVFCRKRS